MDTTLTFGRFELKPRERVLLAGGVPQELGARAFDLLAALVRSDGALLTKDLLMREVWPGAAVEENNLHAQIGAIRRALGAERDAIITVAGRGYRFGLPVMRGAAQSTRAEATPGRLSLAVLPFRTAPGEAEAMADGVTESLTTDLSRALGGGIVASRASAQAYRGRVVGGRQIGQELGVRYALEGSLVASADRVRVHVQLIDTAADMQVWADRFDLNLAGDGLMVQDIIVGRLARQVVLRMVIAEARLAGTSATPDADGLALQGYGTAIMSRMSPEGVPVAREMFNRSLALDPDNSEATAGLAILEAYALVNGFTPASDRAVRLAEADALAQRVLAVDSEHLGALRARAVVLRAQGWFSDAIVTARTILSICPRDPPACREMGLNHLYLGEPAEALRWFQQAEESGPGDPARWSWMQGLGRALLQLGRDPEAVAAFRVVVESNAGWATGHGLLAAALLLHGEAEAARARFAEFVHRVPDATERAPSRRIAVDPERVAAAYHQNESRIVSAFAELEVCLRSPLCEGVAGDHAARR